MTDLGEVYWYGKIFRYLFATIDKIVYGLVSFIMEVFYLVAGSEIRFGNTVTDFFNRIQLILGIIVLFKLVISLFSGIMDPDSISDEKKGIGNIIKRVVVVLIMIIMIVPLNIPENDTADLNSENNRKTNNQKTWNARMNESGILFGTMAELQSRILNGNVIPKLILGQSNYDGGEDISLTLLKNFIFINLKPGRSNPGAEKNQENWVCSLEDYDGGVDNKSTVFLITNLLTSDDKKEITLSALIYMFGSKLSADELYKLYESSDIKESDLNDTKRSMLLDGINAYCDLDTIGGWGNERYYFVYKYIFSTAAGVLCFFLILSLTVEVAIRVFKLVVLRLISPIAILSYIDSKSEKTFNNWVKAVSTTYLDLFIRIAIISFILLLISIIPSVEFTIYSGDASILAKVFARLILYIGLLYFAKEAPKFITETLGIDSKGNMGLFSGIGKLRSARATVGGFVSGGISRAVAARQNGANIGRTILAGITGAVGGGVNSGREFFRADSDANSIRQANQRRVDQNYERVASGSTARGRALSRLERGLGLRTRAQRYDDDIKDLRDSSAAWSRLDNALNSDDSKLKVTNDIKGANGQSLFKSKLGYSLEGIDDIIKRMEDSGQYSDADINAVKAQRSALVAQHGVIKGANGQVLFTSDNGYSVKDFNDIIKDMENSGQYSAEDLMEVRQQLKRTQALRFGEIAREGDAGVELGGTAGQVYQAANTIVDIGTRYSDEVKGFSAFGNVNGATLSQALESGVLNMARDFKGGTFDAGREADAKEASNERKNAMQDDAFSQNNNNNNH